MAKSRSFARRRPVTTALGTTFLLAVGTSAYVISDNARLGAVIRNVDIPPAVERFLSPKFVRAVWRLKQMPTDYMRGGMAKRCARIKITAKFRRWTGHTGIGQYTREKMAKLCLEPPR